jgi:hypothetical protein
LKMYTILRILARFRVIYMHTYIHLYTMTQCNHTISRKVTTSSNVIDQFYIKSITFILKVLESQKPTK